MKFLAFWKKPLNQAALATAIGSGAAVLSGTMTWQAAVPVAIGALVAIVIPDDAAVEKDAEAVAAALIKAGADLGKGAK